VREAWCAWERGDMEALFTFYDPDIEWDQTRYLAGGPTGIYPGHAGVRRFFREWLSPFEAFWAHAEEFIDAGECVVVRVTQGGRGTGSGIAVTMPPYLQLYRLWDRRAVRIETYSDEEEALKAAGLAE
jgi:ketosteroid isomerase-like protein